MLNLRDFLKLSLLWSFAVFMGLLSTLTIRITLFSIRDSFNDLAFLVLMFSYMVRADLFFFSCVGQGILHGRFYPRSSGSLAMAFPGIIKLELF